MGPMSPANFMKINEGFGHMSQRKGVLWSPLATPTANHVE